MIYPVFTKNPYRIQLRAGEEYTVSSPGGRSYTGRVAVGGMYDISPVLNMLAPDLPFITGSEEPLIYFGHGEHNLTISIGEKSSTVFAIRGGFARHMLSKCGSNKPYNVRLRPDTHNFLLTTRTNHWHIKMKQGETACPLLMVVDHDSWHYDNERLELSFYADGERFDYSIPYDTPAPHNGIMALDLRALFAEQPLGNVEIEINGAFACQIEIERPEPAPEHNLIRFRNSFGAFELLELAGRASVSVEPSDDEDDSIATYDALSGRFFNQRRRISLPETITVPTGFIRPDRLNSLFDMLASDEVYLANDPLNPLRVIPSAKGIERHIRFDEPLNTEITLKPCFADENIHQALDIETLSRSLFTQQFEPPFM